MKVTVIDVETDFDDYLSSAYNPFGNVYAIGIYGDVGNGVYRPDDTSTIQQIISSSDLVVGHNLKFDLHWLERLGIDFTGRKFYDSMIGEYLISGQSVRMKDLALNVQAKKYLNSSKIDVVKEEYWNKGINTDKIPWDVLAEYCLMDCKLTYDLYQDQQTRIPDGMETLIKVTMADMRLLQQMEKRGIKFDVEKARQLAKEAHERIMKLEEELMSNISYKGINLNSNDQLSCLLYGGTIVEKRRVPNGVYGKTAKKAGEVKYKIELVEHHFPRKYKPLKGSEAAKEGYYSTDDETLTKLSGKKGGILDTIKELRRERREYDTYLIGIPKKIQEYNWQSNMVHGNYNTCLTSTGRLSSSRPNLQNLSKGAQRLFVTSEEQ